MKYELINKINIIIQIMRKKRFYFIVDIESFIYL